MMFRITLQLQQRTGDLWYVSSTWRVISIFVICFLVLLVEAVQVDEAWKELEHLDTVVLHVGDLAVEQVEDLKLWQFFLKNDKLLKFTSLSSTVTLL